MNVTGQTTLGILVQPFTLINTSSGRTVAVLSLTDPTHLALTKYSEHLTRDYRRSLLSALHLRDIQPASIVPSVVVCMITAIPVSHDEVAVAGTHVAAATARLHQLVDEAIGVDLFILGDFEVTSIEPYMRCRAAAATRARTFTPRPQPLTPPPPQPHP